MPATYTSDRGRVFRFNDHVVIEMVMGVPDEKRTGRLVQVRKGKGSFMSDLLFIRLRDGSLCTFDNVLLRHAGDKDFEEAFYLTNGRTPPHAPEQPPFDGDSEATEYLIGEAYPETGFVIEQPKQPDDAKQSFSMMIISK